MKLIVFVSVVISILSLSLLAAEKHKSHSPLGMNHSSNNVSGIPEQGGQDTFSALTEIVALLENNPETDWSKVDITGLRLHLLDMNQLMLNSAFTTTVTDSPNIQFTVSGSDLSIPAIHRMVPAHASFIELSRGWEIDTNLTPTGAEISISVNDAVEFQRIEALGFYGFMSLDSHHQMHHLQMAQGKSH